MKNKIKHLMLFATFLVTTASFAQLNQYQVTVINMYTGNSNSLQRIQYIPGIDSAYCTPPATTITGYDIPSTFVYGNCSQTVEKPASPLSASPSVTYTLQDSNNTALITCQLNYSYSSSGNSGTCTANITVTNSNGYADCTANAALVGNNCIVNFYFYPAVKHQQGGGR